MILWRILRKIEFVQRNEIPTNSALLETVQSKAKQRISRLNLTPVILERL